MPICTDCHHDGKQPGTFKASPCAKCHFTGDLPKNKGASHVSIDNLVLPEGDQDYAVHALMEATETPEEVQQGLELAAQAFSEETPERGVMMRDFMAVWLRMTPQNRDAIAALLTGGDIASVARERGVSFQAVHSAVLRAKAQSETLRRALPHIGREMPEKTRAVTS